VKKAIVVFFLYLQCSPNSMMKYPDEPIVRENFLYETNKYAISTKKNFIHDNNYLINREQIDKSDTSFGYSHCRENFLNRYFKSDVIDTMRYYIVFEDGEQSNENKKVLGLLKVYPQKDSSIIEINAFVFPKVFNIERDDFPEMPYRIENFIYGFKKNKYISRQLVP